MSTALVVDIVAFVVLFALSAWVRSRFRHRGYSETAAGAIVMAIGIFVDAALTQLPFYSSLLARLITIEVLVIWLFLAYSYLAAAFNRHFRMHVHHPLRRFALGTWVAGTAVLAVLAVHAVPEAPLFGKVLALVAAALYLPYVAIFVQGYYAMIRNLREPKANGVILLATVSTESIVLAIYAAFASTAPSGWVLGMVVFDLVFLCTGLALIAWHYHARHTQVLAMEWKNTNCIVHGAVSITGLTLVTATHFDADVLLGVWLVALVLFAVVELLEVIRLFERTRRRGLRPGILVYDVSQWTRNFTYGMFYAFTLALDQHLDTLTSATGHFWHPAVEVIAGYGQYVVLAFLLIEIALFLRARLHLFWPAPRRTGEA